MPTIYRLLDHPPIEELQAWEYWTPKRASSAEAYRRLGDRTAYVRQRGFEPLQQEQMVLQYVDAHAKITRRETAELCRIGSLQARDLLERLTQRGDLQRHGQRKGTFYTRTSKNMDGPGRDTG